MPKIEEWGNPNIVKPIFPVEKKEGIKKEKEEKDEHVPKRKKDKGDENGKIGKNIDIVI